MAVKPIQTIPYSEKISLHKGETVPKFIKDTVDYYIGKASFNLEGKIQNILDEINGLLDESSYKYVTNPYNEVEKSSGKERKLPARLRNYDIITPVKQALLGELNQRPNIHVVVDKNVNVVNHYKEEEAEKVRKQAQDLFVKFVQMFEGADEDPNEIKQEIQRNEQRLLDENQTIGEIKASSGQDIVDYLKYSLDTDEKLRELFEYWFDVGRIYTYKSTYRNDVVYDVVHPSDLFIEGGDITFAEDADACVRRLHWTFAEIIDKFRSVLDDEQVIKLQNLYDKNTGFATMSNVADRSNINASAISKSVTGYHVTWKSQKKIGILQYIDELGILQEKEVEEDYKINKEQGDIELKWEWINEIWETYKFDEELYILYRPILEQRNELNNSSKCKQPYNGRVMNKNYRGYDVFSLGRIGLTYQKLYNVIHFRFEHIMAKNKEKLMLMPLGLIPKGWTRSKFMYFVDATGFAWFDETNPKLNNVLNALKSVDMSLGKYASETVAIMQGIKQEWWDFVGMNRQRYGDVKASDGKSTTEQALYRSAILTDEFFRKFDKFFEKELQGLLDISKVAYIDGIKSHYVASDGRIAMIDIEGTNIMESEYGVFLKDNADEISKLNRANNLLQALAQNGVRGSQIIESIEQTNISNIKKFLKRAEAAQDRLTQQNQQVEQEAKIALEQQIAQRDEANNQTKKDVATITAKGVVQSAIIQANAKLQTANFLEKDNLIDTDKATSDFNDAVSKQTEAFLKQTELNHKIDIDNKTLNLKKEEIKSKERIAKQNKNKYDKK